MGESFLDIDLLKLEEEWQGQPSLYKEHADNLADAERELGMAEDNLEWIKADLLQKISADPSEYGLAKTTVDMLNAAVIHQKVYREAREKVLNLKHDVAVLKATVRALDHRKTSLENETKLFIGGYWSVPWVSDPEIKEMVAEESKKADRVKAKRKPERNSQNGN